MPDAMDLAAELIERQTAAHIAAALPASGPGSRYCVDCDAEIPQRRRDKHPSAIRCVPCQEKMEIARAPISRPPRRRRSSRSRPGRCAMPSCSPRA